MEKLILFRGISVRKKHVGKVRQDIIKKGINGDEGFWRFELNDLRGRLEDLFNKPDLSTEDTRLSKWIEDYKGGGHRELIDEFPTVCAADELGAHYYALVHNKHKNKNEVGLIISFEALVNNIYVDGRDFLYTCFQLWDRETSRYYAKQKKLLVKIYGSSIEKYFEKASRSKDQNYRIAMYDLATQDIDVVKGHYKNNIIVGGRYGTVFKAAFFIKVPISSKQILDIKVVEQYPYSFIPDISLRDFLEGKI